MSALWHFLLEKRAHSIPQGWNEPRGSGLAVLLRRLTAGRAWGEAGQKGVGQAPVLLSNLCGFTHRHVCEPTGGNGDFPF